MIFSWVYHPKIKNKQLMINDSMLEPVASHLLRYQHLCHDVLR